MPENEGPDSGESDWLLEQLSGGRRARREAERAAAEAAASERPAADDVSADAPPADDVGRTAAEDEGWGAVPEWAPRAGDDRAEEAQNDAPATYAPPAFVPPEYATPEPDPVHEEVAHSTGIPGDESNAAGPTDAPVAETSEDGVAAAAPGAEEPADDDAWSTLGIDAETARFDEEESPREYVGPETVEDEPSDSPAPFVWGLKAGDDPAIWAPTASAIAAAGIEAEVSIDAEPIDGEPSNVEPEVEFTQDSEPEEGAVPPVLTPPVYGAPFIAPAMFPIAQPTADTTEPVDAGHDHVADADLIAGDRRADSDADSDADSEVDIDSWFAAPVDSTPTISPAIAGYEGTAILPVVPEEDSAAQHSRAAEAERASKPSKAPRAEASPREPMPSSTRTLLWIAGVLLALVVILGVVWLLTSMASADGGDAKAPASTSSSSESSAETKAADAAPAGGVQPVGVHAWDSLGGGECVGAPFASAWDEKFTVVDCSTPHPAQLVYRGSFADDASEFPGQDALASQVNGLCSAAGVLDADAAAAVSDLQLTAAYPVNKDQWASARDYYCFASRSGGGELTASVAGSGPAS